MENKTKINIEKLNSGLYFIVVQSENGIIINKFIKE